MAGHIVPGPKVSGLLEGRKSGAWAGAWVWVCKVGSFCAHIPGTATAHPFPARAKEPYQFFKTRVVIRAAMTMMRETVMVII